MDEEKLSRLTATVQRNCHISDARHGTDYTLCTYLMKMREYYRWEKGLSFTDSLPKEDLGNWLMEREDLWEQLDDAPFESLEIDGQRFDPFDEIAINEVLNGYGLAYSSGLGRAAKPHFFLGDLETREETGAFLVLLCNREYARDLSAPPAMNRARLVVVRRESLRRMLWEKLESWRWSRPQNAMGQAFGCYDFENQLQAALDAMTETELKAVLLHEIGEYHAGRLLGEAWNEMLLSLTGTPGELIARAVKDHLADCMHTLPELIQERRTRSVHFYLGNLSHMRKEIFPGLFSAYTEWVNGGEWAPLETIAAIGHRHWADQAEKMLAIYERVGDQANKPIQQLIKENYL